MQNKTVEPPYTRLNLRWVWWDLGMSMTLSFPHLTLKAA